MEGGVEHGNLGLVGHDGLAGADTHEVGGVVQGAQGDALLNGGDAGVVDEAGLGEGHAAVQDAVAHGVDLIGGLDHAIDRIHQDVQNGLDGFGMGGHGDIQHNFIAAGDAVVQPSVDADSLAQALGGHVAGVRVHQLILQRRTACVDNQYIHVFHLL